MAKWSKQAWNKQIFLGWKENDDTKEKQGDKQKKEQNARNGKEKTQ